jgi:hypothetical protein
VVVRLDQLLHVLLDKARELGDVTHGELVAALIHTAPTDVADLSTRVTTYRWAKVHSTLLDAKRRTGSYRMPPRKIGRPRTR